MPYTKTNWNDRTVQYPNRFTQSVSGSYYTLTPSPGTVTQAGTPITSAALNNIENGIVNVDSRVTTLENHNFNNTGVYVNGTTWSVTSANTYTQFPTLSGVAGVVGSPNIAGFTYGVSTGNPSDLVCQTAGYYLIMVWSTLSGLNPNIPFDIVSRIYINSNGANYVDDSVGTVGTFAYSGTGGNHGAPEGVYLMYQSVRNLGVNDLLRFYAVIGEAPRSINKFAISIIRIS